MIEQIDQVEHAEQVELTESLARIEPRWVGGLQRGLPGVLQRELAAQREMFRCFVRAIADAVDGRDACTRFHSANVANYAAGVGFHLGMRPEEIHRVHLAGLLHDLGKLATPERILLKPDVLNIAERQQSREHVAFLRQMLEAVPWVAELQGLTDAATDHHERLDGSGYPQGKRGWELSLPARVVAVADLFHALTQDRRYRPAVTVEEAMAVLQSMTPRQLDGRCVDALKRFLGLCKPPGCRVAAA